MIGMIVSKKFDVQAQTCVVEALSHYSTCKFNAKKFKGKWDPMNREYSDFKFIFYHIGFDWDPIRNNIDSIEESWNNLL